MKRIVLDIETTLDHNTIWMVVTKDIDTGEVNVWKAANNLVEYLKDTTLIVAHNGISFDFQILNKHWNTKIRLSQVYDTLIASRLLNPSIENGHSLEAWGDRMGSIKKVDYKRIWQWLMDRREEYKGECFNVPHMSLLEYYCIRDVEVTCNLYKHLTDEFAKKDFSQESLDLEHKVAAIIAEQERNGFKLDLPFATCLLADIKGKMAGIYEQMQERWPPVITPRFHKTSGKPIKDCVDTFNPGSRKQIGEKLMELGWKPKDFTEKGQPIVDESVLAKVKIPEAQMIAEYLMLQKRVAQIESWLEAVGKDGRVHGKVITNGAVSGRATHSTPNMAQIPATRSTYGKECRSCWTVEEGNVLVGTDLSGIELRCFAHYLNDPEYSNEVVNGDVHTRNQNAFGVATRDLAKTVLYATLYGASPGKVGTIIGGSEKQGKKIIDNFQRNVPAYAKLKKKVSNFAAKGWIPGLDGRKLQIRSEHSALNTLLQSAGAIIAKQWIVCFHKELTAKKIPFKLVAWVHDEVQIEVPEKYGTIVGEIVVKAAADAGEILKFRCPVGAEFKTGKNWYDCH
jgi:DNA polymerase I-like protein with 3'-5' exonuclease and polymerase domains